MAGVEQNVLEFVQRQKELLALEKQAEASETAKLLDGVSVHELERRGVALTRLHAAQTKTSLYGRTVVKFQNGRGMTQKSVLRSLPASKLRSGDVVSLSNMASGKQQRVAAGVITRITETTASVAFENPFESELQGTTYVIIQMANEITHKRMVRTLEDLACAVGGSGKRNRWETERCPGNPVIRALFSKTPSSSQSPLEQQSSDSTAAAHSTSTTVLHSPNSTNSKQHPPSDNTTHDRHGTNNATTTRNNNTNTDTTSTITDTDTDTNTDTNTATTLTTGFVFEPTFVNTNLNPSQQTAVKECLFARTAVSVIHGPPGTGKTTTVIELITQLVKQGKKVLAAAPSNIAVDNLVERLATNKVAAVRIGHPARIMESARHMSLDARVDGSDEAGLVRQVRAEMDAITKKLANKASASDRREYRSEFKELRKELRRREGDAVRQALKTADVVLGTLAGLSPDGPVGMLSPKHFDVCVVDEAGQALETACWTILLNAPRCILAGDHLQLPPTITSTVATNDGLGVTLLERAVVIMEGSVRLLDTQYRMHDKIMRWSSDNLYDGRLVADGSVKNHLLSELPGVTEDENTTEPLVFIDTAGCGYEETSGENESKSNEGEAQIVARHVQELLKAGVPEKDIGIITPYNGQVELLRQLIREEYPQIDVKSVDGFQGREKEVIIISLVRCNPKRIIGFLAEHRRLNVAVTRARRHLCVVGDSLTVSNNTRLKTLIDFLHQEADLRTAHEYGDVDVARNPNVIKEQTKSRPTTKVGVKPREKHDEAATESKRVLFRAKLDGFVATAEQEYVIFDANLNSYERRLVHEIATEMGLLHTSQGTVGQRRIIIWKTGEAPDIDIDNVGPPNTKQSSQTCQSSREGGKKDNAVSSTSSKPLPKNNKFLNSLQPQLQSISGSHTSSPSATTPEDEIKNNNTGHDNTDDDDGAVHDDEDDDDDDDDDGDKDDDDDDDDEHEEKGSNRNNKPPSNMFAALLGDDKEEPDNVVDGGDVDVDVGVGDCTDGVQSEPEIQRCKYCGKDIPIMNIDIHVVRCEREERRRKQMQTSSSTGRATSGGVGGRGVKTRNTQNHHDPEGLYNRFSTTVADTLRDSSKHAKSCLMPEKRAQLERKLKAKVDKQTDARVNKDDANKTKKGKDTKKKK